MHSVITHPPQDNPGTFPEGPLKVLTFETYREPSGDSQETNTKIYDLLIRLYYIQSRKNKYSNVVNGDVRQTSTGNSCGTSRGPNNATFQGRPRGVDQTCFLNSTQKHIKLTLTGYSRLYREWQWQIIQCSLWFKKIIETKTKHREFRDILIKLSLRVCGKVPI